MNLSAIQTIEYVLGAKPIRAVISKQQETEALTYFDCDSFEVAKC
jgi:hypothetical protein